jgi:hypothetical protein
MQTGKKWSRFIIKALSYHGGIGVKNILLASAALFAMPAMANAAIVVQTTKFITTPTNFNGFEAINLNPQFRPNFTIPGTVTHTEDGISVNHVGAVGRNSINTRDFYSVSPYVWSVVGSGYTRITRSDGSDFSSIQFLAASRNFSADDRLYYNLLNNGVSVATGTAGKLDIFHQFYGFSGGGFDEVWLQQSTLGQFSTSATTKLTLDSIALGSSVGVPEPAAWAMMLAGFGLVGTAMRRREKRAVTCA